MDAGQRRRASGPAIRRGLKGVRKASRSGLGSRSVAAVDGRSAGGSSGDPSATRVSGGLVKAIAGVGRLTRAGAMARRGASAAVGAPMVPLPRQRIIRRLGLLCADWDLNSQAAKLMKGETIDQLLALRVRVTSQEFPVATTRVQPRTPRPSERSSAGGCRSHGPAR